MDILRAKQRLKGTQYGKVFIQSSKNHGEHLAEINTKVILENSSLGKDYKLTSNGYLIQKAPSVTSPTNSLTQAVKASGGVCILTKMYLTLNYDITSADTSYDGIIAICMKHKISDFSVIIICAYIYLLNDQFGVKTNCYFSATYLV